MTLGATKKPEKEKKSEKKSRFSRIMRLIGKVILICFLLSIFTTAVYRFVPPPVTPLMIMRTCQQAFGSEREVRLKKDWVAIDKISPNLINAVVASEDNLFLDHNGFDMKQLQLAMEEREKGKRIRGGSTISMQTAKNVFLIPHRSFIRKGFEAYFTCLIEFFWSKKRIMEVYLNVIEFGDGIYGAEAAANYYFHKKASQLTSREAALMAACLPNPLKRSPTKPTRYLEARANKIQTLMRLIGPVDFDKKPVEKPKTKKKSLSKKRKKK